MFDNLSEENMMLYAAKTYDRPNSIQSEFEEDFKRIRYIKRILQKYRQCGKIKERLLLNHLIVLQNVFGVDASTRMLFFGINEKDWSSLKTFLVCTSAMPKIIRGVRGRDIIGSDIPIEEYIVSILRDL